MNIVKQMLQLSTKQNLQLSKEFVEYIASIIPPAVSNISPEMSPEVAAIFATALKSTCFKIIDKASEFLDEGADIREINVDWRANYFDKGRLVHDAHMQTLWARILAGEANNLGTYSKRSVNFLADIDKRDAQLFTELCRYVCEIKYTAEGEEKIEFVPLILDEYLLPLRPSSSSDHDPIYHIQSADLEHLDNIGLIRFAEAQRGGRSGHVIDSEKPIEVNYYGESICLSSGAVNTCWTTDSSRMLRPPIGRVKLTQIGYELYPICGSTPIDGFFSHICHTDWLPYIKGLDDKEKVDKFQKTYKRTWERETPVTDS